MRDYQQKKRARRKVRIQRVRAKIFGTAQRPRASVYRSLNHIYVQLIDDTQGKTLLAVSDHDIKNKRNLKKIEVAKEVGSLAAEKAVKKKIKKVVFDRKGYKYHGRIRALAEGMREKGLVF